MKEVMEKEETDPFYSSLYGGFYDEENDAVRFNFFFIAFFLFLFTSRTILQLYFTLTVLSC